MFWVKRKKEKEKNKMTTLEQVRKAYEDLSDEDKKTFHQSLSDRVHESIAAQERADGDEDTQTAADREHEALGAEHADERREHEEREKEHEEDQDERHEEHDDRISEVFERLDRIDEAIGRLMKEEEKEDKREKYGLSAKPTTTAPEKKYTAADVDRLLGK